MKLSKHLNLEIPPLLCALLTSLSIVTHNVINCSFGKNQLAAMDSKTAADESPPALNTEQVPAADALAEGLGNSPGSSDDVPTAAAAAAAQAAGGGAGEQGRLASIVPTLGRFANRAHKASAPYLSYAAMASQEAARWVRVCVRVCVCVCVWV